MNDLGFLDATPCIPRVRIVEAETECPRVTRTGAEVRKIDAPGIAEDLAHGVLRALKGHPEEVELVLLAVLDHPDCPVDPSVGRGRELNDAPDDGRHAVVGELGGLTKHRVVRWIECHVDARLLGGHVTPD